MPSNNPYMRAYDPFSLPRNITTVFPKVVMEPKVVVPGYNIYTNHTGTYLNGTRLDNHYNNGYGYNNGYNNNGTSGYGYDHRY